MLLEALAPEPSDAASTATGAHVRLVERVFLDDPAVPIDNNTAEQKMRRVALGRNNFLFAGSANGGKALAILYSLVATCEQHRINPQAYLEAAFA